MKKKVLMSIVLLAIIGTSAVFAQQPTLDKLDFNVSATAVSVKQANDNISGTVVIPDNYNNLPVTAIATNGFAFNDNKNITSVTIGKNVVTCRTHVTLAIFLLFLLVDPASPPKKNKFNSRNV
ncbi:MAG: hypothetical protein LBC76_11235 [Treponema sp.]|jgi:hypothetical protein|nr:hypothetical protein [Treponema sp.]